MKKVILVIAGCLLPLQGAFAQTTVFEADFDASAEISGSVTANASAVNLNSGTSVGSWDLPYGNPGAIISDGGTDNAFVFDRVTSAQSPNEVKAVFSSNVDLAGGEKLTIEMDLYAARQAGGQRVEFSLDDVAGNSAYTFVFRMNNTKDFYTLNTSGQITGVATNGTGVNNGFKNPAVNGNLNWGSTMIHVKVEVSGQTTQAGSSGAMISIDWNGDGDYDDDSELNETGFGPRNIGVSEISALRVANNASYNGGAWIDNVSVTVEQDEVSENLFNLAKYQKPTRDSATSTEPSQYATDGIVAQDSRWISDDTGPHWLALDLGTPMTIGSAHLYSGGAWDSAMANFVLQYHDGSGWVDIAGTSFSGNTLRELELAFTAPITAQQFRLYTTDTKARVKELALYPPTSDGSPVPFGTDVDLNIAKLRQYEYSSVEGANYPKLAIDGYADDSSVWASTDAAGPHDLEIHLQQTEKIRGIQLYSGYEGRSGTQIEDFEVAYDDGGSWVVFTGGSVTGNTALNLNLWFGASANTKKIRIRSLDASQAVIRELVVLPENNAGGYPLWTDAKDEAPPSESFLDYDDAYHTIENRDTGMNLSTSANGSYTTSDEPWFQVLLNLGTDTYRLRSKDSEQCFEIALASTNEGAAIVEGEYSSLPHQRWRLVDTGDGTHFQIKNVWSGLVLDLDGTNVVQQSADADQTQHWKINYEKHYPKKGQAAHFHFNSMYKPGWFYGWNHDQEGECDYGEYMPMQWGGIASSTAGILRRQPGWYGRAINTTVLGFNEPNLSDQANMTEETAAYQWPRMERMRMPLGGPCPSNYQGSWRTAYEAMAAERGFRSEYMTMHWYSTSGASSGSPSQLINNMQTLYNTYGKPICLTEFSTRNFSGTLTTWSRNHNYNFLAEFMWRAESLPWLKRWSLFEWGVLGGDPATTDAGSEDPTDMNSPRLGLHYNNDKTDPGWEDLAECGLLLAGWDGNATVMDETAYIIHNKGRFLRLIDHPDNSTISYADVLNRNAAEQFMLEAAPGGNKYITGLSDGRRLRYNGSSVGLAAAGTTGPTVEWELNEAAYGWFFIDHPSSGKRLRIMSNNVINVDNDTNTGDNLKFRFIKHYQPITIAEMQTLPYAESFENGIGAWRQFYDQDKFWEVGTGGTPTAAAGPSGAADGDNYLFSEGHDAGSYVTNMVECTFDLSASTNPGMTFEYHMYGTYIDFLAIDIHDGTTWTPNVWIRSGQQHTSSDDGWTVALVDLTDYAGDSEVTIRFRTANKLWNAADPAIDNIRIDEVGNLGTIAETLPYAESFETGFGAWTQSTEDDFDWTRWSGYTPTDNTGPSGASDGTWYLYIEGNDIYDGHNKIAQIECVFDLSTVSAAALSFDYHMYGANIDYLAVDVSDGTNWTSDVWKKSLTQHASSEAAWSNAVVDLSAHVGNDEVTIRFRAKEKYWHVSDIAIDNIRVENSVDAAYWQWVEAAFAGAPPGTDESRTGNPDGDLYSNEQEWALVLNPMVPDLPEMDTTIDSSTFSVQYDRRSDSGISVYASWASSLTAAVWRVHGDGMTEETVGTDGDVETREATVPLAGEQKFIRIEVEN